MRNNHELLAVACDSSSDQIGSCHISFATPGYSDVWVPMGGPTEKHTLLESPRGYPAFHDQYRCGLTSEVVISSHLSHNLVLLVHKPKALHRNTCVS